MHQRKCATCPAAEKMFARMNKCGTIDAFFHLYAPQSTFRDRVFSCEKSSLTSGWNLYILLKMSKFGREAGARMSPRVQASESQKRLRTPRIPFLFFKIDFVLKALMKSVFLFIQGFFITKDSSRISALILKNVFLFIQSFFIAKDTSRISALILKEISLFIQSFFITPVSNAVDLFRIVILEKKAFKEFFLQYDICFPTSVL